MSHQVVMAVRCRVCGKPRSPHEFVGGSQVGYCWRCFEWHQNALDVLAGGMPKGCQVCDRSIEELFALAPGGDLSMMVHVKDGIYQVLCRPCSDDYERKRLDMYGGTPYAAAKNL